MTSEPKPLRLTTRKRPHAAGVSRRLALGLSAAAAAALSSLMADGRAGSSVATMPTAPTTTPSLEPLVIHVRVTRPWSPPPASAATPPRRAISSPTVTAAPRSAPPTTESRAS